MAQTVRAQEMERCPVVRALGCSCRRLGFHSYHPPGSSDPSVTPVPGKPRSSFELFGNFTCIVHIQTGRQKYSNK